MFPILQPAQVRRDDRADRAVISRAVGVAADVSENRADVQASAAADAVERVALLGVRQQFRAVIVQQHDVTFFRAVGFAGLARAAIQRVVAGHGWPAPAVASIGRNSARSSSLGKTFSMPSRATCIFGQRGGQAGIAFVFRDGNHAGLGDGEICAGDAHVGLAVFLPHDAAGDHRQLLRIVRRLGTQFA